MAELTHLDSSGAAHMVDVGDKPETLREARAQAVVNMAPETLALIAAGNHKKGDVLAVARIAGIGGAKRCADIIPLCHPLMLTKVAVDLTLDESNSCVRIETLCKVNGPTGVEMEALSAASAAALTIYDMCKAVDRGISINHLELLSKTGGASGQWQREASEHD